MSGKWQSWVRLWDQREPGDVLAVVRIGVGLALVWDLVIAGMLGLVVPLWAPLEEGGFGPASYADPICAFYRWFGASAANAWVLYAVSLLSALCMTLGLFSRSSALVFVLGYAQLSHLSPAADRGIDNLLRNVCLLLACADCGATLSLDSRLFHGRWWRDTLVPAWPRYLLIVQLMVVYFGAGMLKQSPQWTSLDHYSALYVVLQRPHFARFALPKEWLDALYPFLQLSTIVTVMFERSAPLVPVLLWFRATRTRAGRLRAFVNRSRILPLWVGTGVVFHLGLALFMQLGIFPWGCLAIYPALAHPSTLRGWATRARDWLAQRRKPGTAPEPAPHTSAERA